MSEGIKRSLKPLVIMIITVVVLFGLVFGYKAFKSVMGAKYMKSRQIPVFTVSTATAHYQNWPRQLSATGSFSAVLGTYVTSEINGLVRHVYFRDGDTVRKNALLLALNTDTEVAQLHVYQAQARIASITYHRDVQQFAIQGVSKQQVQNDYANIQVARSQIEQEKSIIAKKMIRAPFSGRLGISTVNRGDYMNPGDKIVTIQALDPIYALFTLPQQNLPQLHVGQPVGLKTNLFLSLTFTGTIKAINPLVDSSTRNVTIEALVKNPQKILLPGIFTDVILTYGKPKKILTLPITAVSFNPYGQIVYLVKNSGKKGLDGKNILTVTPSFVKVGESRGDQIQVLSGVKAGDIVVSSGQLKLKNGSRVVINNSIKPSDSPNPQVGNEQI